MRRVRVRTGQGIEKQAGAGSRRERDARPSLKLRTAGGTITSRRLRPRSTRPRPRALGQVSRARGTPFVSGVSFLEFVPSDEYTLVFRRVGRPFVFSGMVLAQKHRPPKPFPTECSV